MDGKRATYHHGNLPAALVDAAARMVEEAGEQGFSLRECAKSLGVDVAAVYRHYASKDALIAAVAQHGLRELEQRVRRAVDRAAAQGPAAAFLAIGSAYVAFAVERPTLYGMVFDRREPVTCDRPNRRMPPAAPVATPAGTSTSAYGLLCACLDRMVDAGLITAAARQGADVTAWAAVHGLASLLNQGLIRASGRERVRLVESLCRTVLDGLRRSDT